MWQKEEDRQEMIRAKELAVIVEAERIYRERIEEISQKARIELDSPPDVLTPAEERKETGKREMLPFTGIYWITWSNWVFHM